MYRSFRLIALILCLLTIYANATDIIVNPSKRKGAGPWFRIMREGKWGYMDRNGKTRITPAYKDERDFMEGLAAVSVDGTWGYINERGEMTIPPQFDEVGDFVEGVASVRSGRRWGYIDHGGRMVIAPQFQAVADFHEGLARVYVWEKVVCRTAKEYTKDDVPEYLLRLPGLRSLESSCFPQDAHFGFVDKTGALVVPARFYSLEDLSEGLAVAKVDANRDTKYGYVDRTGSFVISPRFNQAHSFSEGLAGVEVSSRIEGNRLVDIQRGYIDNTGRVVIPAMYQFVGQFSEGLARVEPVLGQAGYIDRDGKMVIAPRFHEAWDFSEGMAAVCDPKCRYINRKGEVALEVEGALWPFSDGLTVVPRSGSRQRYIDSKGRTIARYN